jgi:hypothetical protein
VPVPCLASKTLRHAAFNSFKRPKFDQGWPADSK